MNDNFWGWLLEYRYFDGLGGEPNGHAYSPEFKDDEGNTMELHFGSGVYICLIKPDKPRLPLIASYNEAAFRRLALFSLLYPLRRRFSMSPEFYDETSAAYLKLSYVESVDYWCIMKSCRDKPGYNIELGFSAWLIERLFLWYLWRWAWGDWLGLRTRLYVLRRDRRLEQRRIKREERGA